MEKENKLSSIVAGELGVVDNGEILELRTTDPILTLNREEAKKLNEFLTMWIAEPEVPPIFTDLDKLAAEVADLKDRLHKHIEESKFIQL